MIHCCDDLKYAIETGDVIHNVKEDTFHIHGQPSFVDDGDGYTDDITETLQMSHCFFCGKALTTPPPSDTNMIDYKCPSCGHEFQIDASITVAECPDCGYYEEAY